MSDFSDGIFSTWIFRCQGCGAEIRTQHPSHKPPFCECRHRNFDAPFLRKFDKPPLGDHPELLEILRNPMPHILRELEKHFVGEQQAAKTIFLVLIMRLVRGAEPTSGNLLVNSESGAGKDFVVIAVLRLFDANIVFIRSRISPTVLNYWHQNEPDWTWDNKGLFLADISSAVLNADSFKTMASGQNSCTITERGRAVEIEIKGKPSLILTSAFPNPSNELLRRFPIISLDEGKEQTKKILRFHGNRASENIKMSYDQNLRLALDYLEDGKAIVPFAQILSDKFPERLISRTAYPRLLDFIRASTILHQFAREKKEIAGENFFVAQKEDYSLGAECFLSTCSNAALTPLTQQQRKILDFFAEHKAETFSFAELRDIPFFSAIPERTMRRQLEKLLGFDLLFCETHKIEDKIRPVQRYWFKAFSGFLLPEWEEIQVAWQNRQNGTMTNNMAEQAELAEREKSEDLIQSAQSAHSANEIALCPHLICIVCGGKASVSMKDGRQLCAACYSREKGALADA